LESGNLPTIEDLSDLVDRLDGVPTEIHSDPELSEYWLVTWQRSAKRQFEEAWRNGVNETREAVRLTSKKRSNFDAILQDLGLYEPQRRGSGLLTAIAAVVLGWCEPDPRSALALAAKAIGSDTDTIGTMAGALFGAVTEIDPPVEVLDADLISREALRMAELATGDPKRGHQYPDLLTWSPPKTQADALVQTEDRKLHVLGLGPVVEVLGPPQPATQGSFFWQWVRLDIGQTLYIKARQDLPVIHLENVARRETVRRGISARSSQVNSVGAAPSLFDSGDSLANPQIHGSLHEVESDAQTESTSRPLDLSRVFEFLEEQDFDDRSLAYALKQVARRGSTEQVAAFLAALLDRLRQ
jgi:hypothetical protein